MAGRGLAQHRAGGVQAVGHVAQVGDDAALAAQQRAQHEAVGVVDRSGRQRLAGHHQLIPGGEQRDARPRRDVQAGHAHGGRQADGRGVHPVAGAQHGVALHHVLALASDGHAGHGQFVDAHRAERIVRAGGGDGLAVFLHHHGIRAGGNLRPGEDARRGAGGQRLAGPAGDDALAHRQQGAGAPHQVGQADRIAVHRAVVFGRHVHRGHDVLRQHAGPGLGRGHVLDAAQRRDGREQACERVVGADERAATGGRRR